MKPALEGRPEGGGAISRNASRKGRTPKLVIAEPKNIGESWPVEHLLDAELVAADVEQVDVFLQLLELTLAQDRADLVARRAG